MSEKDQDEMTQELVDNFSSQLESLGILMRDDKMLTIQLLLEVKKLSERVKKIEDTHFRF